MFSSYDYDLSLYLLPQKLNHMLEYDQSYNVLPRTIS